MLRSQIDRINSFESNMKLKFILIVMVQICFSHDEKEKLNENKSLPIMCHNRKPRIVGGSNAFRNEAPFIVSLTRRGGHFCGASIISDKWIITAGHCLCNGFNNIIKPSHIKGRVGLYKISEFEKNTVYNSPSNSFEIEVDEIILHPDYKCSKPFNDIALLKIVKPIIFTEKIQPACISSDKLETNYNNLIATVFGWGWTNENQEIGERSDILKKASVKIWNRDVCQKSFNDLGKTNILNESQICAGYENGGIDSCWADSGGPLIIENSNFHLVGIVSTGIGCARPGLPGIYTKISSYIEWIEKIVKFE